MKWATFLFISLFWKSISHYIFSENVNGGDSEFNWAFSHHTAALCWTAFLQTLRWPCGFPPALSLLLPLRPWSPCPVCKLHKLKDSRWDTLVVNEKVFILSRIFFFKSMHSAANILPGENRWFDVSKRQQDFKNTVSSVVIQKVKSRWMKNSTVKVSRAVPLT